jgi:hypothetical protein
MLPFGLDAGPVIHHHVGRLRVELVRRAPVDAAELQRQVAIVFDAPASEATQDGAGGWSFPDMPSSIA